MRFSKTTIERHKKFIGRMDGIYSPRRMAVVLPTTKISIWKRFRGNFHKNSEQKLEELRKYILMKEFGISKAKREIEFKFNFKIKNLFEYRRVVALVMLVTMIGAMYFQNSPQTFGATYTWDQIIWDDSATPGSSIAHLNTGTTYESKDANLSVVNGGADLQLGTTTGSVTQTNDGSTNTGFNLSGNSHSQTQVSGTGDSASVKLATNGYAWGTPENVEILGNVSVGQNNSTKIDTNGKAHISYYDATNHNLKYATNASGSWVTTNVDSTGDVGQYTSIALDTNGKAYISYQDATYAYLKYATNVSGSWVTTAVDSTGIVGAYTSIALDVNGKAYISYYDTNNTNLKYATNASGSWVLTTVDSTGIVGLYTSIALDTDGKAYISYQDVTNADLKYATNASGSWVTTAVDSTGVVGLYTSIALDVNGKAYISYFDDTNDDLKYATNASGSWVTATVDSTGIVGAYTSIALHSDGKAHISYFYSTASDLKYATNASGSWVLTTVESTGNIGPNTSIALDVNGKVYISYTDTSFADLKHATNVSGSWVTTTIEYSTTGFYSSMKLDTNSKAHISYYDSSNYDLKYATNASGSWVTATVDSTGLVGQYTSITLDTDGKAHISYYDDTNDDLKYATNASGSWVITTVDSTGDVGQYTSIALDTNGKAYISYYYVSSDDLKYATNASGSWVTATVDSIGLVGQYTSIALDTNGKAHISYYNQGSGTLKYATNASGSWVTTTVDPSADVGYYTSIALDTNGKVYFSYYYASSGDLKYATNASGSWVITTVDSTGTVGQYTSIALDTNGKAYISYYDVTNLDLKYATNASGSWVLSTIASANNIGQYSSLGLDPLNIGHISFYNLTTQNLNYVTQTNPIYYSSGTFTSGIADIAGYNVPSWGNLSWNATLGGQTLVVKARSCDDAACSGEDSTKPFGGDTDAEWDNSGDVCNTITSGATMSTGNCVTNGERYLQYRARLKTTDTLVTPSLDDITLGYNLYDTNQNLISSAFNSSSTANALGGLSWTEDATLPSGTGVTVSLRTASSQGGLTGAWTDFTNATANCSKEGSTVTCSELAIPAGMKDNVNDQWFQYKVTLTSTGENTPTVGSVATTYVVNSAPDFDATFGTNGVSITQLDRNDPTNPGKVQIDYKIRDIDTASGSFTANYVTPTFEYTLNGTDYTEFNQDNITFGTAPSGGGYSTYQSKTTNKVLEGSYLIYTAFWDAKTALPETFSATFKIRVKLNDNESANNIVTAVSNQTSLDVKNPTSHSFNINHTTNQLSFSTAPTDNSSFQMSVSNVAGSFPTFESFASPYTYNAMTDDPATVHVRIKDQYGNYTDAQATTPAKPQNPIYFDTSSSAQAVYQEFIAWDVIPVAQTGAGFASYKIYRQIDTSSAPQYELQSTITDRNTNYYLDKIKDTDPGTTDTDPTFDPNNPATYTYKVIATDINGNISQYSSTVSDSPNGTGGSDSTPPTIDDVAITDINTTSAKVTWTTDELASSYVGFSTDVSYLPERGLASMVTSHEIILTGLDSATTYNIRVKSYDAIGNLGQNDKDAPGNNNVPDFTFQTLAGPEISSVTTDSNNANATISWATTTDSDSYVIYSNTILNGSLSAPESVGIPTLVGGAAVYNHSQLVNTFAGSPLVSGATYYFYVTSKDVSNVTAIDNNGGQFYQFATTQDDDAPIITNPNAAIINNTQVAINWTTDEPANSLVNYGTAPGSYDASGTVATYDKSHYVILSDLTPDTNYYYTVTSADINGNSASSGEESFATMPDPEFQHDPLSAITNVSEPPAVVTDEKAVITFVTDQPAECIIEYGTQTGNYTEVPVSESEYNVGHSIHLSGLIFSTTYYYQISCADNLDTTVNSVEYSFVTADQQFGSGELDSVAPEISGVIVTVNSGESVEVKWETDEEADSWIQYGITSENYENGAGDYLINSDVANYATAHTVIINNLAPATKYYYVAVSTDADGNRTVSAEQTFTTKSASSLSGIKVVSTALNQALISWVTSVNMTSIVEYGLTTIYGEIKQSTSMTKVHEVSLSGLQSGQVYHFRVKGKDENNNIYASADNTFEPKSPPQISDITMSSVTEHEATIKFATNIPTDALVSFAAVSDATKNGSQGKPELTSTHEIVLKNLDSGTTYGYTLKVRDADGNETTTLTTQLFTTGKDENAPQLDQVKTDSALAQNDKVQSIISWITDEPATTALLYREGRNGEEKEAKVSDQFTLSHLAVVTIFKPGTVYYFKVKSIDQSENEAVSGEYAMLTPKRKENIIQIIVTNFQDIFGWARL